MKPLYTPDQMDVALGIMSGRIDPETDLRDFDSAQRLHLNLISAMDGGRGNPGPYAHRAKAEQILCWMISHDR